MVGNLPNLFGFGTGYLFATLANDIFLRCRSAEERVMRSVSAGTVGLVGIALGIVALLYCKVIYPQHPSAGWWVFYLPPLGAATFVAGLGLLTGYLFAKPKTPAVLAVAFSVVLVLSSIHFENMEWMGKFQQWVLGFVGVGFFSLVGILGISAVFASGSRSMQ